MTSAPNTNFREVHEWINALVDPETFLSYTPFLGEGKSGFGDEIVIGLAEMGGKAVALYAIDPNINQGFISSQGAIKIHRIMQKALELGCPLIALLASPGISIEEGVASGDEYSKIIMSNTELSGQIPQLAVITSVVMGGSSYSAVLMDFTFFNKLRSHLMVSGPAVVASAMGEKTTLAQLGGAKMHATTTGLAHFVDQTIPEQIARVKWMIEYLPANYKADAPQRAATEPKTKLPAIPHQANLPFDMHSLISAVVDGSETNEYLPDYGISMITTFARIDGRPVGIVANQSLHLSGSIDTTAAQKATRFIRLCDSYAIPILTLIDVPGYLPGSVEEQKGLLRHGSALCKSMYTRSPKLSVVVRRCYGAAAFVMLQGKAQKGDLVLALENARIAVMGFEAAKEIVYKSQIPAEDMEAYRERYFQDYERPEISYRTGMIDQIIPAEKLRKVLSQHLASLSHKRDNPLPPVRGIYP